MANELISKSKVEAIRKKYARGNVLYSKTSDKDHRYYDRIKGNYYLILQNEVSTTMLSGDILIKIRLQLLTSYGKEWLIFYNSSEVDRDFVLL